MTSTLAIPRPQRIARRLGWLGVDIGACAVKIAQIERGDAGWRIHRTSWMPVPTGADPIEIAAEALSANVPRRIRGFERPAACLTTTALDLHNVDLPTASSDAASDALAHSPLLGDRTCTYAIWRSSWNTPSDANQPHHVIRMSQRCAQRIAQLTSQHRIECRVLDCLPYALARTVALAGDASREPVAVVDCAADTPILTIVNRGQPFYTRVLRDCGFNRLTSAVGKRLGLDADEVQCLLTQLERSAAGGGQQRQATRLICEITGDTRKHFLAEVTRTLRFLKAEDGDLSPRRIWLVGGGAALPGLDSATREATGVPTSVWRLHRPQRDVAHATTNAHGYATALALSAIPMLT